MSGETARKTFKLVPELSTPGPLGSGLSEDALSALTAALHCPVALMLATLAGDLVYENVRARRLFSAAPTLETQPKNLRDFCFKPAQMTEIEAVARDGRERQFQIRREIEGLGWRSFLCRVSRVAGPAGIPTWIAFVSQELEYYSDANAELNESAILESYRSLSGGAVWRMRLEHPASQWTKNAIDCTRERLALFGVRGKPSQSSVKAFLDLVHASDRAMLAQTLESSVRDNVPFETVYRLAPRLGRSKVILSRGMPTEDPDVADSRSLWCVDIDISSAVEQDKIPFDKGAVLDAVAANLDGPIYAVDRQFRYLFFNEAFSRNMRELYDAETALHGKAFEPAGASARRRVVTANFRRALDGVPVVEKLSVRLKDSGINTFELTYAPMVVAGQTRGVVVFGVKTA
jgi:hypothetical protein